MNAELAETLAKSVQVLDQAQGQIAEIHETITRTENESLDRHLSTTSKFTLQIHSASWALSGGTLMLNGTGNTRYEVCFNLVEAASVSANKISYIEDFGAWVKRHTDIHLIQNI